MLQRFDITDSSTEMIKKSALTLAVAAVTASGAALADATPYGSASPAGDYERYDVDINNSQPASRQDLRLKNYGSGIWSVVDNFSRLGIQGSEDLNRSPGVGLKGGWGALTLGAQWTPYDNVLGAAYQFNSIRTFDNYSFTCLPITDNALELSTPDAGLRCGAAYLGPYRYDNSILYSTPRWNGLSAQAMLTMSGLPITSNDYYYLGDRKPDINVYDLSLKYEKGPWFAGIAFDRRQGDRSSPLSDASSLWGVGLGYNTDVWGLNFNVENDRTSYLAPDGNTGVLTSQTFRTNNYYLVGRYTFGSNSLRAGWGYFNPRDFDRLGISVSDALGVVYPDIAANPGGFDVTGKSDSGNVQNVILGWEYGFSKRTRTWVEYIGQFSGGVPQTLEAPSGQPQVPLASDKFPYGNANAISIGVQHDF